MQVVLPASMCAQIPIFLYLSRGTMRLPVQQCSNRMSSQLEEPQPDRVDTRHVLQSSLQAGTQGSRWAGSQVKAAGLQM